MARFAEASIPPRPVGLLLAVAVVPSASAVVLRPEADPASVALSDRIG